MLTCLAEYNLQYCGDSIEWCPVEGFKHLFTCGSYQLEPDSTKRIGRIDLFSYVDSELSLVQGLDLEAGLLDAKWAPNIQHNVPLLATALSNGFLNIYKLEDNKLSVVSSTEVCRDGMALAVDWSTGVNPDSQPKLVVSQSSGSVSLLQMSQDASLLVLNTFKAHEYEAWIAAFNYWDTNIVYTGGDDCKLKVFDTRTAVMKPVHTDSSHSVGVTSIQSNQKFEGYFASGSYEDIRIWKSSSTLIECIDKEEMSGGSWRVKWNIKGDCGKIAVAAMHNGFSIVDFATKSTNSKDDTSDRLEALSLSNNSNTSNINFINCNKENTKYRFDYQGPHVSLGYGIDWSHQNRNVLAFCSFYDKKLSIAQLIS